jgi:site-specific DNA-methyltransferase (adenine-specific)
MKTITWHTETRNLSDLIPADYNPRKISEQQAKKLKKSLDTFGYVETVDINLDNTVIGGHQRLNALVDLGYDEIDVRVPDRQLTKKEEQTLNVSLNKITGEFDNEKLVMIEPNVLEDAGFEPDELNEIFPVEETAIVEDELPELEEIEPKAKLGDLYQLGRHRLLCGDCTVKENVELLMDEPAILMVTDPPYGVNYDPEWRDGLDTQRKGTAIGKVRNDDIIDWSSIYDLYNIPIIYMWHGAKHTSIIAEGLIEHKYNLISNIIWVKQHFVFSRGDYHWQHEPCWYAVATGMNHNWQGARDQSTVWQIANNNSWGNSDKEETFGHGTQKPVECMLRPILNNTKKGNVVCDPFLGSGTTIIAAEQSDRICYGMEIDPMYCDIIIARWEKFTGEKASKLN